MKLKAPSTIFADSTAGWCPGCGHGIIVRLLAEAVESLGIEEKSTLRSAVNLTWPAARWPSTA